MAIRPPKYTSQGFTLVEMLVTLAIAGIIMGFAVPSLLSLNKPLRDGALQFKSQLSLIRSKAISSSRAYRIRPKYPVTAQYTGEKYQQTPHNFIVEYAANCQVSTYGTGLPSNTPPVPDGWQAASQLDLDLPDAIGVVNNPLPKVNGNDVNITTKTIQPANGSASTTVTFEPYLSWEICYDSRGIADKTVSLTLKDFQGNNKAVFAFIDISKVGGLDITTKDKSVNLIPLNGGNPDF